MIFFSTIQKVKQREEKYIAKESENGHTGIKLSEKGLIIDRKNPLLAASIDGEVYDPTAKHSPVGNLEMNRNINNFPADYVQNRKLRTFYYISLLSMQKTHVFE